MAFESLLATAGYSSKCRAPMATKASPSILISLRALRDLSTCCIKAHAQTCGLCRAITPIVNMSQMICGPALPSRWESGWWWQRQCDGKHTESRMPAEEEGKGAREVKGVSSRTPSTSGNNCTHQVQKYNGCLHSDKLTHCLSAKMLHHCKKTMQTLPPSGHLEQ